MYARTATTVRNATRRRDLHLSAASLAAQPQLQRAPETRPAHAPLQQAVATLRREQPQPLRTKRNEVGVQLLSRRLHEQIFKNASFPPPDARYVRIAQDHLQMHGLDRTQGSVLPDIGFTLPALQGNNLDEHFHRIGADAAQPWLSLSKRLVDIELPPQPDEWNIRSGWTKYHYDADGLSYSEPVDYPPEDSLVFDVETLPGYSPWAIMATAVTSSGWYAWISPWLLGETENMQNLIPLGPPDVSRVVVGHNVSYDRARVFEEYGVEGTNNRFIDTMALHVAVKGISSNQRPVWMKHRKAKLQERERKEEAYEAVVGLLREIEAADGVHVDETQQERMQELRRKMEEDLSSLLEDEEELTDDDGNLNLAGKRWEDITSGNSLADVAKLHCNIDVDKTIRNDFMVCTREEIRAGIQNYLTYCSEDVAVTHAVYAKVLPQFLTACPSPVSFAGVLTMGSSFLPVNETWEKYIEDAEHAYRELEDAVKTRLIELAHEAKDLVEGERWRDDVWLSQLDWTPKIAKASRGIHSEVEVAMSPVDNEEEPVSSPPASVTVSGPAWYNKLAKSEPFNATAINRVLPLLLRLALDDKPLTYSTKHGWHCVDDLGEPQRLPTAGTSKTISVLGPSHGAPLLKSGALSSSDPDLALSISSGDKSEKAWRRVLSLARKASKLRQDAWAKDPWLSQLDWKVTRSTAAPVVKVKKPKPIGPKLPPVLWPKWYWELAKPKKDCSPGTIDLTPRSRISPLLLRMSWKGFPMFHSRQHGWTFRVPRGAEYETRVDPLEFFDPTDASLQSMSLHDGARFYKIPHKDGDTANVGSPLSKTFVKFAQDGTMTSPGDEAQKALEMNAQCSYWISARDRVMSQAVVWQNEQMPLGVPDPSPPTTEGGRAKKWGVIVPHMITMGTVTRRAIERTWLTASNAKKNRVGSELKAMVRAPDGYAIVGADVDSEELWISSVMGDAQFGLHGATAIGWMTLEGTKAQGTDLHSKTASILGISRDQAKVFNYSRIYGAGMRHAVLLLLQGNSSMAPEEAQRLAEALYASTKGKNTHRSDIFGRKFWFGGSESFVFNKLEEIALSSRPKTPALGCGVTYALSKEYLPEEFGSDYMPSRINWVVQSSGVDYLHLLIVSMSYLIKRYDIKARFLISVHDELRYLVKEEDAGRAALALQIANLWTRSLFAYRLGMDDLPQGVAFFSAVDVDHVLRKETDMPCTTPSQPVPIPPGKSYDIAKVLEITGGTLHADGRPMEEDNDAQLPPVKGYVPPDCLQHRADSAAFLQAQATADFAEIRFLAQQATGVAYEGGIGGPKKGKKRGPGTWAGQGGAATGHGGAQGHLRDDWADVVDEILSGERPARLPDMISKS
ncbi:gamma DNA-directed DNA polymerase [Peniophora sp. CONT]|nr:gamma DNA-directed DNA polymerase [Peniophora sp. CONT]